MNVDASPPFVASSDRRTVAKIRVSDKSVPPKKLEVHTHGGPDDSRSVCIHSDPVWGQLRRYARANDEYFTSTVGSDVKLLTGCVGEAPYSELGG